MLHLRQKFVVAAGVAAIALSLSACSSSNPSSSASAANSAECIENYDANTDYFPAKSTFDAATGVTVEYQKSYKVVTVQQPLQGADPETYVLVQCGAPTPALTGELEGAQAIEIPVKRVATSSTTQLPGYVILGSTDVVVGVENTDYINGDEYKDAIADGTIKSYGSADGSISPETVASLKPDLYVASGFPNEANDKIKELGIPVVGNAEWLETTPLGRAEWLKFEALFINKEAAANTSFTEITTAYNDVASKVTNVTERPTVVTGSPYEGDWYISGGKSYMAKFLSDAGADYVFADNTDTGSITKSIEEVLSTGGDATFWLNATSMKGSTLATLTAEDSRFKEMAAVGKKNVWSATLAIGAGGGNNYYQLGVVRPDLVLADMVEIFHPGTLTDHTFTFYEHLADS